MISTNLLLLDEIFDSSLDNNGVDYVMNLLDTIGDQTNVLLLVTRVINFSISLEDKLDLKRNKNYSVMS